MVGNDLATEGMAWKSVQEYPMFLTWVLYLIKSYKRNHQWNTKPFIITSESVRLHWSIHCCREEFNWQQILAFLMISPVLQPDSFIHTIHSVHDRMSHSLTETLHPFPKLWRKYIMVTIYMYMYAMVFLLKLLQILFDIIYTFSVFLINCT